MLLVERHEMDVGSVVWRVSMNRGAVSIWYIASGRPAATERVMEAVSCCGSGRHTQLGGESSGLAVR